MTTSIGCRCKLSNKFSQAVLINLNSSRIRLVINNISELFVFKYGDYTENVPPVPIPNTEVKFLKADDSGFSRESRSSPFLSPKGPEDKQVIFCLTQ